MSNERALSQWRFSIVVQHSGQTFHHILNQNMRGGATD